MIYYGEFSAERNLKMKKTKAFSAFCAALLLVGASGCGSSAVTGNETDTAAVSAALEKLASCTSCTSLQTVDRVDSITAEGVTYTYRGVTETEIDVMTAPAVKMKTTTKATMEYEYEGETLEQTSVSYIVPEDGGYSEYYFDGTDWYTVFAAVPDAMDYVSIGDFALLYVTADMSFGKAKTEDVNGVTADRYDAALGGDALVSYLSDGGYLSSISSMSENQQQKIRDNLAKDLDALTVSVWIDTASGYPVRFELDMTDILVDLEKSIARTLGNKTSDSQWAITAYSMRMELSSFNAIEDIVPPPESADAIVYTEEDFAQ